MRFATHGLLRFFGTEKRFFYSRVAETFVVIVVLTTVVVVVVVAVRRLRVVRDRVAGNLGATNTSSSDQWSS